MKNKKLEQYEPDFGKEEADAVYEYMKTGAWLTEHIKTREFEEQVSSFLGVKNCITVNNGTISLSLALLALGVKPGDNVIVPTLSMIATANAVTLIGAKPIFYDIEPETLCLDVTQSLDEFIELWQPKAIIYVSLNGRRGYTNELRLFCKLNDIGFIEDAAQAFGSESKDGQKIGTLADITSFSLSPHKIISTGQGGLLTTDDDILAQKLRRLKDFGRDKGGNDIHDYFGINSKFTDLQAVIGIEQLKKITNRIIIKKALYNCYKELLSDVKEIEFISTDTDTITPWFCDLYTEKRDILSYYLMKDKNIRTRKMYPPIHKQQCYKVNNSWKLPVAEKYSKKGLWLPSSFNLSFEQVNYICESIKIFFSK